MSRRSHIPLTRPVSAMMLATLFRVLPVLALVLISGCQTQPMAPHTLFSLLRPEQTGIDFNNKLSYDEAFNIFTYRNYYTGGGVAVGDINNDGLPDIFFTGNQVDNRLYLNKGNFQFEDITSKAGITKSGKWSTGVAMADVNGDGLLDIYVCSSGMVKGDTRPNQLFINNGNGTFTDKAKEYGIQDGGYSTHAAFFDYDHDGDMDLFLLRNASKPIGSFNLQHNERNIRDTLGGDKLYRNDGGHFTDVSREAGIYGSVIGFGLGVTVGDVNKDGWPDIYVSNDFFERDYLYINNKDGTFREELENQMHSISNASMGADMADINNDGYSDIFVTEMLPEDESRIKINTTFENWEKYQLDLHYGYWHQFTRNTLQLNLGNITTTRPGQASSPGHFAASGQPPAVARASTYFSEIGRLAGVQATDWSWGALITDLDNDGFKDIFVANGIYKDLTNEDYIQYISNGEVMTSILTGKDRNFRKLIDLIPSHPIPNYAFHNNGDLHFTNMATEWGLDQPGFSNGSAYADLDNDGDLDLIVNNLNMPAFVYRNNSVELHPENKWLKLILQGEGINHFAIGAKATVYHDHTLAYQEEQPIRGFESSVDSRLNFGLGKTKSIDSVVVEWPSGKRTVLRSPHPDQIITLKEKDAGAATPVAAISGTAASAPVAATSGTMAVAAPQPLLTPTTAAGLDFAHRENDFNDFNRDRLLFSMLSTAGPRVAVADINGDGLDDIYLCGAKGQPGALYIQSANGSFALSNQALFEKDAACEDVDALFFDADGDGDPDLFVCSGGNEFSPNSTALISRLYFNDGHGHFTKSPQLLPSAAVFESASCVTAADYDGDGDLDLFVGVRLKPFSYGYPCKGYILQNNGKGIFVDVTALIAPDLLKAGMVTDAKWVDYDKDGRPDLVLAGDYMPVRLFHNEKGTFKEVTATAGLAKTNGWWNRIVIADLNGDGYPDIIAGNHGLNSRFKASESQPITCYTGDFDENGTVEQIVCCYNGGKQYPMALRHDLVAALPFLKKKYLHYEDYKEQTIDDIFTKEQLDKAVKLDAYELASCVFLSNGKGGFTKKALPTEAQFSTVYGIKTGDFDHDGFPDLLIGGNFYQSKPEAGIYDASYGLLLKGDGKGGLTPVPAARSGFFVKGAVRDIQTIKTKHQPLVLVAKNNDAIELFK
jgi:hypothetical protein